MVHRHRVLFPCHCCCRLSDRTAIIVFVWHDLPCARKSFASLYTYAIIDLYVFVVVPRCLHINAWKTVYAERLRTASFLLWNIEWRWGGDWSEKKMRNGWGKVLLLLWSTLRAMTLGIFLRFLLSAFYYLFIIVSSILFVPMTVAKERVFTGKWIGRRSICSL